MERQPLISIIIPVYNVEQYLDECMTSVLNQTYTNIEIILVNDGSVDNSPAICDSYAIDDSRVKVIHKENRGLVSAWIDGVKVGQGEYLVFLDSDDWIDVVMIEEMVKQATGKEKEIVCGNYIIEKKNQSINVKQSLQPGIYNRECIEKKIIPQLLGKENRIIHYSRCMKLISRELIIENVQYIDEKLTMGEDAGIMVPAVLDAQSIIIMEEAFYYHYRSVDTSMAHKYNAHMYEKVELLYETLQSMIEKKYDNYENKKLLLNRLKQEYIFLLFFVLKNELRGPKKACVNRVQKILQEAECKKGIGKVKVEVQNKANELLYYILKHPNRLSILFGRGIIRLFDLRQ